MDEEDGLPLVEQTQEEKKRPKEGLFGLILRPIRWVKMLCDELRWSFVLSVGIVYGLNQGLGMGLSRLTIAYYMKDVQKLQPSEAQVYSGIILIPFIIKPLWGLLTDIVPINGYRRRPYFVFAGFLGVISMLTLSLHKKLHPAFALVSLMGASAGVAIADVTIDACITEKSIMHPPLAADMQSLCALSSSIGLLLGYSVSGILVHQIGPRGVFGVLCIPSGLVILVGVMLKEPIMHNFAYSRVNEKLLDASKAMWTALKCRFVWQPCLYMYLSLALCLNIHEGMFYWYTDAKTGPSFSQEVVGSIFSIGAVGSISGVLLYQNVFKHHPFRQILFWTQLLYGASGMLDLILLFRINLKLGVPDFFFVVIDEAVSHMIGRLKWMPLLVLSSKLCPSGIEGTFFALLMSIDHIGKLSSSWLGGILLHVLNVTRTQFDNLWIAILIRSLLRILPISLLFLVPKSDPDTSILPPEMLRSRKSNDILESRNTEMAPLDNSS
ncbi:probable folate-biopterin transporter 3 [Cornus florida]|uniref:probable folate-biopterin transporter 3 n=1 Tax=Cornus florida TaxID=4283 RepID=UPI00289CAF61|nr:probable folate-biopterin transporter 3 [Cornus florida]